MPGFLGGKSPHQKKTAIKRAKASDAAFKRSEEVKASALRGGYNKPPQTVIDARPEHLKHPSPTTIR